MDDIYIVQSSKYGAISTVPVTKMTEVENSVSYAQKLLISRKSLISSKPIIVLQISEQLSRIS